ncbi:MAG: S1 RNA-binding domain-containing protein [Bacteroidia bacterium]
MLQIGEYQTLTIAREMPQGLYLEDEDENEVLMPRAYIADDHFIEDKIEVLVYTDSEDRLIATTEKALLTVGEFAILNVHDVNNIGAFCDWGVSKELFIPFSNQAERLRLNRSVVVHMYLDEVTDRLVGTTKIDKYLDRNPGDNLRVTQEVDLMVYAKTDLGYKVVINKRFGGLVYNSESPNRLAIGQELKGYIKPLREDGKVDVSLFPIGVDSIEPNAKKLLDKLQENGGFLPFNDKSDPDAIRREFGISKKLFKKAVGSLYKQKLILIKKSGIQGVGMGKQWD